MRRLKLEVSRRTQCSMGIIETCPVNPARVCDLEVTIREFSFFVASNLA